MNVWVLVFMFHGMPMASGPHELPQCLLMAEEQTAKSGIKAHCFNIKTMERK